MENIRLKILTRPECHLCDEMKDVILKLSKFSPITLETIDITSDRDLLKKYRTEIPVLFCNDSEIARHRIDEGDLKKKLLSIKGGGREKILIVKISSLGDLIHAIPFVNRLKSEKPDTVIDWVVADIYTELIEAVDGVRNVIPFRKKEWRNFWRPKVFREIISFIRTLRSEKYDLCLDLQGLFRSGFITHISGSSLTAGFSDSREGSRFFYDKKIEPKGTHAVDKLLSALSIVGLSPETGRPDFSFTIPRSAEESANLILKSAGVDGEYVVFHTGARWKTKLWIPEYWRELAETVYSKYSIPIVFTGSAGDSKDVAEIVKGLPYAKNLCGKGNLLELSSILRGAKFMTTVDSGPMHIGAAFGVPMVAIFGPTSPDKTGPVTAGRKKIFSENAECAPCLKRACSKNHECMTTLTPDKVALGIAETVEN